MNVEITGDTIPNWEYGNVGIKTFSFGDNLKIAGQVSNIKRTVVDGKTQMLPEFKEEADMGELALFMLAAGVNFVRTKDGAGFIIKPASSNDDKKKLLYGIDKESGEFLLSNISKLNEEKSEEEKKN